MTWFFLIDPESELFGWRVFPSWNKRSVFRLISKTRVSWGFLKQWVILKRRFIFIKKKKLHILGNVVDPVTPDISLTSVKWKRSKKWTISVDFACALCWMIWRPSCLGILATTDGQCWWGRRRSFNICAMRNHVRSGCLKQRSRLWIAVSALGYDDHC